MEKNKIFLSYLINARDSASITEIVKLSYLIDLSYYRKHNIQITGYNYIRYFYGPYDQQIEKDVKELVDNWSISIQLKQTMWWLEYLIYQVSQAPEKDNWLLSPEELLIIDDVLATLSWSRASQLTEIAYSTWPMKRFGATLWWKEHLHEKLDFDAK